MRAALLVTTLLALVPAQSVTAPTDPARALALALRRIGAEGRLLVVTAHPDDEDNSLLAYYKHGRGFDVTLLTITRGDGGQNEIGEELFEAIGVLRSEELRAAHLYDGARQRFTRAFEFGYSFSVTETFEKWGEEQILRDVVKVVREVRPHVIVTMSISTSGGGRHHQASAFAARRAFDLAAEDVWPELGEPWAAQR
ncbi:MAG: PIG-L family deacetylase, partial [Planctomycetes bacterium]|nr:PIG-L family deacetylase [Planctomycetota bacterium]